MKANEYEALCHAVESGEEKYLENLENRHAGKAVACKGEEVEIDIFGKRETWRIEQCSEIERPNFDYHR